jgi:hypothetical protein
MSETYYFCPCGNGYENKDTLEYHLRKEHTKGELAHFIKIQSTSTRSS